MPIDDQMLTAAQGEVTLAYLNSFMNPQAPPPSMALAAFGRAQIYVTLSRHADAAREAEQFAIAAERAADGGGASFDPLVVAAYLHLLAGANVPAPGVSALGARLADEMAVLPSAAQANGRVRLIAKLLTAAGLPMPIAPLPAQTIAGLEAPDRLIGMTELELSDIADHLMLDSCRLPTQSADILTLVALAMLRDYRVDTASKLLRALLSHNHRSPLFNEAIAFVAIQRGRDGGYGFFDPFTEAAANRADIEIGFRLPITVNAVWLFGDLARSVRLTAALIAA